MVIIRRIIHNMDDRNHLTCPTCGATLIIDIECNSASCRYCRNTFPLDYFDKNKKKFKAKNLYDILIEKKYIYYIPRFDGVNDCLDFLSQYTDAIILFNKDKDELNEKEKQEIITFLENGCTYLTKSIKNNINKMTYRQLIKFEGFISIFSEYNFADGRFKETESLLKNALKIRHSEAPSLTTSSGCCGQL